MAGNKTSTTAVAKAGTKAGTRASGVGRPRGGDADESAGTVERVVRLITYLASAEGEVSVKAVAAELALPQSTAHRLVTQLVSLGLLQRAGDSRRYEFGAQMYRLGAMIASKINVVQVATPALQRVVDRTREGCAFGLLREKDLTLEFAAHIESPQPLRYRIALYDPVSILWGASGRSILAFMDPGVADALAKDASRSPTGQRPVPPRTLHKELAAVRERGYAVSRRGEKIADSSGVSAPVFGPSGRPIGCLSLTIPGLRYPHKREREYGEMLIAEAKTIADVLGGRGP